MPFDLAFLKDALCLGSLFPFVCSSSYSKHYVNKATVKGGAVRSSPLNIFRVEELAPRETTKKSLQALKLKDFGSRWPSRPYTEGRT